MFSLRERIIATNLWPLLWHLGSYCLAGFLLFSSLEASFAALSSPLFIALAAFAVLATFFLTTILSPFLAFFLFSELADYQVLRNGGPFSVDDRIVVVPGRNSGRYGTVTSVGQCNSLRITLDGDENETSGYDHYQLKAVGSHDVHRMAT